jgi:predicted outer membrane repeat protein
MSRLLFATSARRFAFVLTASLLPGPLLAGIALPPVVLTVGSTGNCDHSSIQHAIDAAPDSGSAEIRISNNVGHTNEALEIFDKNIELRGGYAGCDLAPADPDDRTTIGGTGGSSVIFVDAVGDSRTVVLRNLVIRDGGSSDPLTEYGGGVRVQGLAQVEIRNSHVADNTSHNGGGIGISGSGAGLLLDDGTIVGAVGGIPANRAVQNGIGVPRGGGISCSGATIELYDARLRINTSEGNGGGLYAVNCTVYIQPSPDYVAGDNGANGWVTFFENQTEGNGGAIYADDSDVFWQSSNDGGFFAGRLNGNVAGGDGGALYLTGSGAQFLGEWVRFESSYSPGEGGAIFVGDGARLNLSGTPGMHCDYATCPGIVDSNLDDPQYHDGAGGAIYAIGGSDVFLSQALIANNAAQIGSGIVVTDDDTQLLLRHVLVHRNFLTADDSTLSPINIFNGADATLIHVTMSTNVRVDADTLLAPPDASILVSNVGSTATLSNSIFTDDGVATVRAINGGIATGSCLLSHENESVTGVLVGDPDYVAPFADVPDFTPGPASPALDRCAQAEEAPLLALPDFTGRARPIDLFGISNAAGSFDIGAIERPRDRLFSDGFETIPEA